MTETQNVTQFPWQPQSFVRGNLAMGNLHHNILRIVKNERGIHAETAMAAFGVVAGCAAQHAAWAEIGSGIGKPADMIVVDTKSGERFYLGDRLNSYLLPQEGFQRLTLWPLLCGVATQCGVAIADLPPVEPIFARVSRTLGSPDFDWPDVPPDHRPGIGVRQAVGTLWPFAKKVLQVAPPPGVATHEPELTEQHWAVIAAVVAQGMLKQVKDVLAPKIALSIAMGTAIAASKVPLPAA